jgi:hypothetical protein
MGKPDKEDRLLKLEAKKYFQWVQLKGYTKDRYSLIAYFNRKGKIKSSGGKRQIILGCKSYSLEKIEDIFCGKKKS